MSRTRSFDLDHVVECAKQTFWKKGYAETSINDLLDSTGLKRGSLYNTFGDKQTLFVKSLLKYDRENRRAGLTALEAMDDPRRAMETLFCAVVRESVEDTERKGCLLVNTALELPMHSQELQVIVRSGLRDFEACFVRLLDLGKVRGQFPQSIDSAATAKTLLAQIVAIRVLARGAFEEGDLRTLADQAMQLLSGPDAARNQ